jgi:hypothetical protein
VYPWGILQHVGIKNQSREKSAATLQLLLSAKPSWILAIGGKNIQTTVLISRAFEHTSGNVAGTSARHWP